MKDLKNRLQKIDGKSYKDIEGVYDFSFFTLHIVHMQGDPFAAPSRIRVSVEQIFLEELWSGVRRVALEDDLSRRFQATIFDAVRGRQGKGKGGLLRYL